MFLILGAVVVAPFAGGECADDRQIQCEECGGRQSVRDNNASHLCLSGVEQGDLGEYFLRIIMLRENEDVWRHPQATQMGFVFGFWQGKTE